MKIILKRILNKSVGRAWSGLIWLRKGKLAGSGECGNECSIIREEFLN
jgi:hypothetical protein